MLARHPYTQRLLSRGLLDQVQSFSDLEQHITALADPQEQQKAFESFVEGMLVTMRLMLIKAPCPLGILPSSIRANLGELATHPALHGVWSLPGGATGFYHIRFAVERQTSADRKTERRITADLLDLMQRCSNAARPFLLMTNRTPKQALTELLDYR